MATCAITSSISHARVPPRRASAARSHGLQVVRPRQPHRRQQPERERGDPGDHEGHDHQPKIEPHLAGPGQNTFAEHDPEHPLRIDRHQPFDQREAGGRERGAQDAAGSREHDAFSEDQPQQPPAAGAQSQARRQLAPPRRAADHQEVGDIGADNQQHDAHRPHEDPKRCRGRPAPVRPDGRAAGRGCHRSSGARRSARAAAAGPTPAWAAARPCRSRLPPATPLPATAPSRSLPISDPTPTSPDWPQPRSGRSSRSVRRSSPSSRA